MKTCTLDELVGEHMLDAVDTFVEKVEIYGTIEDASCIKFRLDGVVYVAVEDPNDGYRSMMKEIALVDTQEPQHKMTNVFGGCRVLARKKPDDKYGGVNETLEFIDLVTGKVALEVGTDNIDDYYPSFVSNFCPENLMLNQPSKYEG